MYSIVIFLNRSDLLYSRFLGGNIVGDLIVRCTDVDTECRDSKDVTFLETSVDPLGLEYYCRIFRNSSYCKILNALKSALIGTKTMT